MCPHLALLLFFAEGQQPARHLVEHSVRLLFVLAPPWQLASILSGEDRLLLEP